MGNNTDILNADLLDDNFSNATGCGVAPVCSVKKVVKGSRRSCKKVLGREVCVNIPTVKTVTNQACVDKKARYKACVNDPNRKKLKDKVKDKAKKFKGKVKKKITKLKDKVGGLGKNFRNKFRSVMRKGILFNIKNNIHGTASKLYPAVATDGEVSSKKYKKSFVGKSRGTYGQVLAKWKSLGGNENDLKNAIRQGQSKRFLKAPYKSANGDDSMALYSFYASENLNYNPSDGYYLNAEGDEEEQYDEETTDTTDTTFDETSTEEVPSQEEKVRGIRAFFAWLRGLFGRNKVQENPYAEGTPEYDQWQLEMSADAGNEPDESEANDPDFKDLGNKSDEDGAGSDDDDYAGDDEDGEGDDLILGMEKNTAIGVGIGAVVLLAIGGYFLYKKYAKK